MNGDLPYVGALIFFTFVFSGIAIAIAVMFGGKDASKPGKH